MAHEIQAVLMQAQVGDKQGLLPTIAACLRRTRVEEDNLHQHDASSSLALSMQPVPWGMGRAGVWPQP